MDRIKAAADRRARQGRSRLRAWQRARMDCGDEVCGQCRVCRHHDHEEYVHSVAPRYIPCSVGSDPCVVAYLRNRTN